METFEIEFTTGALKGMKIPTQLPKSSVIGRVVTPCVSSGKYKILRKVMS